MRTRVLPVACCLLLWPALAQAGECHYLLMFAAQQVPNDPDFSHTFAVFVRASWAGDDPCPANPTLEYHTISWLPANGVVRTLARDPERGRNWDLHESLDLAVRNQGRISLWGPYPVRKEVYCRALQQIGELNKGRIQYKANDAGYRSDEVSNCIHAVSTVVEGPQLRIGSPGWGEIASFLVLKRFRPFLLDETPHHWIGASLGLGKYPIIYRDRFHGPRTSALAVLCTRLFGPERNLVATYGPPAR